ncbi:hypothetical protein R5R35_010171 [Gryllus longicercus]|uniref:Uncharacterized protein n=1 Tax=Gryllus longicercus TaxID=2509291 RepID=A0AAN9V9D0_9ORTH
MGESVLSLLWEGHTSELATVYTSFLENNFLVDCTISAGGQSLKAHKLVLCACSPYFQRLFLGETGKHTFLILLDATFETLKAVIDFMYRGETQIPQGSLKAFLTLAQSLEIKGLNNHFKNFTNGNVSSNTIENDPGNPSEDNEDIAQVPRVSAISEDNPENSSQLHPHCSDGHKSSFENVQSTEMLPPQQRRRLRNEVMPDQDFDENEESLPPVAFVSIKCEEPSYVRLHDANERVQGAEPARGGHNFLQSSKMLHPQQQHLQLGNEVSSAKHFVKQEESLPPMVFIPVNEESEEPMDDHYLPVDERVEEIESTQSRHNFAQPSSEDIITPDDDEDQPTHQLRGTSQPPDEEPVVIDEARQASLSDSTSANVQADAPQRTSLRRRFGCDMAFLSRSTLINHRHRHTGERPHRCGFCGKAFILKSHLRSHLRTHTGERPFRCDVCGDAFARSDTLRNHKRKHTGERPHRCDDCGMGFQRPSRLAQHKHKHTHKGEMPYRCSQCGLGFSSERGWAYHKEKHAAQ